MDFRQAVAAYQTDGDRAIIQQILAYMRDRAESRAVYPGDDASVYVAIRANNITAPERSALEYEPAALPDYRESIYAALGIDIFAGTNLSELRTYAAEVRRFLGANEYEALAYAIERHLAYKNHEYYVVIPALEHALTRADTSHSEREVVRYVNRAFQTEYIRLLTILNGTVRLGRRDEHGRYHNVYVTPDKPDAWRIVLGRAVAPEVLPDLLLKLTAKQRDYVERAYSVAAADIETGNLSQYKMSEDGAYRLKMRYMAGRLGVEESNLGKCFANIRGRVANFIPTIAY
ncbi:hypothetical protein [Paenibacillus sp. sgz5001063]|uniref:hypothetical protein n=1 Tax=Paenibacillus sp. sgz5001063 TaxID=3242474 RepID=UPI0036D37FDE